MMMNLFSMFDPSTMPYSLAWLTSLMPILMMFCLFKSLLLSKRSVLMMNLSTFFFKELNSLMYPNQTKLSSLILLSLFSMILFINMIALTPFDFTPTAHLSFSFTLAFNMWFAFMLLGWAKNFSTMMAHMVPTGTPTQLMNFMVIIEMISNSIRPITLSVRLSANMVAGHLLMSLLGSFLLSSPATILNFPIMLLLSVLELGVSFIQAYVFMVLITLYSTEIH